MSNVKVPKEQQTAYERWEMASFADANQSLTGARGNASSPQKKGPAVETEQIAKIFESARKEAYSKGMQEGFAVGMANARERGQEDQQSFLTLMNAFSHALEQSDEQIADDVLSLALDIAKAMLKVKLSVDTQTLLPVVLDAIHYLPHIQKPARILVHRDDMQLLREYMADEIANDHWQIHEDSNIERGGCQVETGANQVDATNEMRWKRITEALAQNNDWLLA
ncbi:MAG: flagellar assembly protein FliH [Methylotenera sp.]|nr:flagellar assembly protein FliH [Methylotenera sp.]MDO9232911.1 flagellar assembly protein FliH [Methylotenera sp.]MDO9389465.1 flagellar assembly protein FliH [Methylotenera sp.]MDP2101908.1 flagellar assembly protein FliH [Methylotenera sp.]MDP2280146.1 flagellar assembly protein FliH [Methylotenera sp.]